jgi:hypothetical protein
MAFGSFKFAAQPAHADGKHCFGISIAAPDILLVELRDRKINRGKLEPVEHAGTYPNFTFLNRTNLKGQTRPAWSIGFGEGGQVPYIRHRLLLFSRAV